jgi:ankyrin repeat protein
MAAAGLSIAAADDVAIVDAAQARDTAAAFALLSENVDVNQRAADGTTALLWAVYHDEAALIDRLLQAGADVTLANEYGATAMSEAAVRGNAAVIEKLLDAGADADSPNPEGQTALMIVARSSNVAAAELLIARGADVNAAEQRKGQTALMWAAAQSQPQMIGVLLAHGADVNARSKEHEWERHVTAEPRTKNMPSGGFTPLLYAARQGCRDCAERLLDAGADIDMTDPDGITPLLSALLNAHFDTARLLVERGANVNKWDWWGRTPLYSAVDYNTIPHGGRPDRPSLDDTTALQSIELLLAAAANPNAQLKLFPPYRSLRMDRGADSVLDIGTTPLLRAARAADVDAMRLLLDHGALPDLPQLDGITPLMVAAGLGASGIDTRGRFKTEDQSLDAARLLLDGGADVNARDAAGRTALHAAASQGYTELAMLLAERGADLSATDAQGVGVVDAALGRMRTRGRDGSGDIHQETADRLQALLAAATPATFE